MVHSLGKKRLTKENKKCNRTILERIIHVLKKSTVPLSWEEIAIEIKKKFSVTQRYIPHSRLVLLGNMAHYI